MVSGPGMASNPIEAATIRKLRIRLLPFLFALFVVAFIDRINLGFAALTMNRELAITSQQFGFAAGIFFWGYFLFEIPSNLILHRIGARVWIARILITWGAVATLTGFVQSAHQLYIARFALGLAEAGYFPGICSVPGLLVSATRKSTGDCIDLDRAYLWPACWVGRFQVSFWIMRIGSASAVGDGC